VLKEESGATGGGIRKARLSTALVVAQVSMSLLLLVCAGLIARGFREEQKFYPGFRADHMLLMSFDLFSSGYTDEQTAEFDRQLQTRVENLPGVQSAALADWIPMGFSLSTRKVAPQGYVGQPHEDMDVERASVSPEYFKTMEIPMLEGRDFAASDDAKSQPVGIVNRTFAERYWPEKNAIGMQVGVAGKIWTVIGIAQTSDYDDLNEAPKPFFYRPLAQDPSAIAAIHVRTSGDPMAAAKTVENAVRDLNADLPVYDTTTMASRVEVATTGERIAGTFVGAFGLLALVLAAVGIYGVVAYVTRQRTHEFGIRVALGAQRKDVLGLVLNQGLRVTLLGVGIGLGLAALLTRYIVSLIFTVSPMDPWVFAGVSLVLCVVALAACYLPARRAAKVDPLVALRYE
jgi:predicted permease